MFRRIKEKKGYIYILTSFRHPLFAIADCQNLNLEEGAPEPVVKTTDVLLRILLQQTKHHPLPNMAFSLFFYACPESTTIVNLQENSF